MQGYATETGDKPLPGKCATQKTGRRHDDSLCKRTYFSGYSGRRSGRLICNAVRDHQLVLVRITLRMGHRTTGYRGKRWLSRIHTISMSRRHGRNHRAAGDLGVQPGQSIQSVSRARQPAAGEVAASALQAVSAPPGPPGRTGRRPAELAAERLAGGLIPGSAANSSFDRFPLSARQTLFAPQTCIDRITGPGAGEN